VAPAVLPIVQIVISYKRPSELDTKLNQLVLSSPSSIEDIMYVYLDLLSLYPGRTWSAQAAIVDIGAKLHKRRKWQNKWEFSPAGQQSLSRVCRYIRMPGSFAMHMTFDGGGRSDSS
jgi:hypothetical protein